MVIQQLSNVTQSGGSSPDEVKTVAARQTVVAAVTPAPSAPVNASQPSPAERDAQIRQATAKVNQAIQSFSRNIEFSVDEATNITVVRVLDKETNQLIRQIPGDEILSVAKSIDRLQGLIIRQKA